MAESNNNRTRPAPDKQWWAMFAAGAVVTVAFDGVLRWCGFAACAVAWPPTSATLPKPRWAAKAHRSLPAVLVVGLFAALLWELALGRPPVTRDHGIHYFQTHLLAHEFLPSGRLSGWSDSFNNGYPFGESYPWFGYLWVAAAHVLSFGAVSLRTSYAWGILAVWAVGTAGTWWLAHLVACEPGTRSGRDTAMALPRWAAAAAATLWLLDAGGSRQGGWDYAMYHGVWPQMLSAGLWVISLGLHLRAVQRRCSRWTGLAVVALGTSVLAHPFGMLTAATSGAVWLVILVVHRRYAEDLRGGLTIWAIVHGGAALLCAGWIATFLASAGSMARSPVPWQPLGTLIAGLWTGGLLESHWAWAPVLVCLGGIALTRTLAPMGQVVLSLGAALLVLGSHEAITTLRLDLLVSGFKNLQFPRYSIGLRPLLYVVAGVGFAAVVRGLQQLHGKIAPASTGVTGPRVLVVLCIAPLLVTFAERIGEVIPRPVGALDTLESSAHGQDETELTEALRQEASKLEPERLRVAVFRVGMGGGTYPIFSVTDASGALVLDSHVPTVNFKHQFVPRTLAGLRSMGVTHVVFDRELSDQEQTLAAAIQPIGTYGTFTLARLAGEASRALATVRNRPVPAQKADAETLELEISEDVAGDSVELLWPPYYRWRATLDGRELPLGTRTVGRALQAMTIENVDTKGTLRLEYRRTPGERAWGFASWTMLALSAAGIAVGRRWPRPGPAAASPKRWAWPVGLTVFAGLLIALMTRQTQQLAKTWRPAAVNKRARTAAPDLVFKRDLIVDDAWWVESEPENPCDGVLGRDARPGCSEAAAKPTAAMLYRAPFLYRCLEVTVPPHGTTTIGLGVGGTTVVGFLIRQHRVNKGRRIRWATGSQWQSVGNRRRDFRVTADHNPSGVQLSFRNDSGTPEAICVSAAEFVSASSPP